MKMAPVLAMPAAAMTGLYLYNRAKANAEKDGDSSKKNLVDHVHKEADKLHDTLPEEAKGSWLMRTINTTAKYMAVAAVGVGVGLLLTRQGSRYHEFAADAFASEASHNKNSIISALEKIYEYCGVNAAEHDKIFKGIKKETFGAHPSLAERAAHVHSR
jgi:Zn-dependent protease with chaperone function